MIFNMILAASLLPVIPQPRMISEYEALGDEGYRLEISEGKPTIIAGTEVGRVWAKRTLAQLEKDGLPEDLVISDKPKYRVRGVMLDVGRKYIPMTYLYKLVDEMSAYKLNTLHIHLNDNEIVKMPKEGWASVDWTTKYAAFRLECETCPELTAKDGSYTKVEFRAFMKYAKRQGVTIIPEIDVPAHSLAFTRVRPEFASKLYGEDHFDLDKMNEILPWLEEIFREYLTGPDPVFVGPYCHIGTDEYNKKEAEKFRAFSDSLLRMVRAFGYKACAWGALTHAQGWTKVVADKDITLDIWHNPYHHPNQAIGEGYSIVSIPDGYVYIVPKAGYYYDFLNTKWLFENWEPNVIGNVIIREDHPQLLGGKIALWNDVIGDKVSLKDVEDRLTHAIPTIAQKMWSGKVEGQSFDDFKKLEKKLGR